MPDKKTAKKAATRSSPLPGAEGLPRAKPEEVGMSSERLARIRPAMQRYLDQQLIPGAVTLVARHGRVVHLDTIGLRDVESGNPMMADTIFRIASMTKPITSVALMMLFEEGHFLLSDPVSKWIPEFADPRVAEPVPPDEFSGLLPGLTVVQQDPCFSELSCLWTFFNGSTANYACGGFPAQTGIDDPPG